MDNIKVKKRDSSLETWNFDKLLVSIGKAGVNPKEAETIARQIEEWVKISFRDKPITSVEIRQKVFESLKDEFPAEAENYRVYKRES